MTIRSNPPGATVYVDDYPEPIGITPCSTHFTYYGTRKIRLVKDGYETMTVMQPIAAPWYQIPPLDLFSENAVPGELRDRRDYCFQLKPQTITVADQLMDRAERLRRGMPLTVPLGAAAGNEANRLGATTPPPGAMVPNPYSSSPPNLSNLSPPSGNTFTAPQTSPAAAPPTGNWMQPPGSYVAPPTFNPNAPTAPSTAAPDSGYGTQPVRPLPPGSGY